MRLGGFTAETVDGLNANYVGDRAALGDPYAFAANADVAGLPPTLVLHCGQDTLHASSLAFAEQLAAAGVPVRSQMYPGAAHGVLSYPDRPEAHRGIEDMAGWIASLDTADRSE